MDLREFESNLYFLYFDDLTPDIIIKYNLPRILWLPKSLILNKKIEEGEKVLIYAKSFINESTLVPILFQKSNKSHDLNINIDELIKNIKLEKYYDTLAMTIEMRLPFNYSKLPCFIKGFIGKLRIGRFYEEPLINFPEKESPNIVDWLEKIKKICFNDKSMLFYPDNYSGAVIITHDVDSDWILKNNYWLDKICDLENEYGFKGAWFIVPEKTKCIKSIQGIEKLILKGNEIGCHGFNHDAKLPFKKGKVLDYRLSTIKQFVSNWNIKGFRSEWLWRNERLMLEIAKIFKYDTSIPTISDFLTKISRNGCATFLPYKTFGNITELPVSLPMDEERKILNTGVEKFWEYQFEKTKKIIEQGGVANITIHPQPHQFANEKSIKAFTNYLKQIDKINGLWKPLPINIVERYDNLIEKITDSKS